MQAFLSDTELWLELQSYDDVGYEDMPEWLRQELEARNITFQSRNPTEYEMKETEQDAIEHRIMNHEMTIDDHLDMLRGRIRI